MPKLVAIHTQVVANKFIRGIKLVFDGGFQTSFFGPQGNKSNATTFIKAIEDFNPTGIMCHTTDDFISKMSFVNDSDVSVDLCDTGKRGFEDQIC